MRHRLERTAATLLAPLALLAGCDLLEETTDPFAASGSEGGGVIAFVSNRDGNYDIFLMDAEGGSLLKLTEDPALDVSPAWSPDGARIAFATQRGDFSREIYVMDANGRNPTNVSRFPVSEYNPCWSPDGEKIAFDSMRDGNSEIYVMDADGDNPVRLTDHPGFDAHPTWSPDGTRLVFEAGRTIYIHGSQEADSAEVALLELEALAERNTTWNFAFKHQIYVMNADGSSLEQLTRNPFHDTHPAWSPDGKKIAFVSDRDGDEDIFVMDADGANPVNLTGTPGLDTHPAWSPDGKKIAFVSDRDGHKDIFAMGADGANPVNLTGNPRDDLFPAWMPASAFNTNDRCLLCPGRGGPNFGF